MRLIDADRFEAFGSKIEDAEMGYTTGYVDGVTSVLEAIDAAPTVDAVQVVRCINCRQGFAFFDASMPGGPYVLCGKPYAAPRETHKFDYFCADGIPKEDDRG